MDLDKLAEIVEDMTLQHDYPGFDVRSLKLGLPLEVTKAPAKLFSAALTHRQVNVRLAALRWFWERPGIAQQFSSVIGLRLKDEDEWVRMEAVRCIERMARPDEQLIINASELLRDPFPEVRKAAAKACGKLGCRNEAVIEALKTATEDPDHEVKWKAQKALRQLGSYVA